MQDLNAVQFIFLFYVFTGHTSSLLPLETLTVKDCFSECPPGQVTG